VEAVGNPFFYDGRNNRFRAVRFGAGLSPPGASVEISRGSLQSAPLGSAFTLPLEVSVKASWGTPAPNVRVDFQAPASAPSCVFAGGVTSISVLTDRSGKAQAVCRAAGSAGSYEVRATPIGSSSTLRFSLSNSVEKRKRPVRR